MPSASTWQQRSAGAFTISGSGDIAPLVGDILSAQWAGASIVNGTIVALLFVIVLATLFATSEYRRGLIRTTLAASPRRGRVLAAKAAVAGSLAFAAGSAATAIAEVVTRHVLAGNGSYLFRKADLTWPGSSSVPDSSWGSPRRWPLHWARCCGAAPPQSPRASCSSCCRAFSALNPGTG